MNGFLARVLEEKSQELARKRRERSLEELHRAAAAQPVRDFRSAIAGGSRIIAEIKRRSPSGAVFRQQQPPEELAAIFAGAGAAAISLVTDTANFGTSLADVAGVRKSVELPVLAKDFFVTDYQLAEARAAGADAVLLIARILPDQELARLLRSARELGASALVECHDAIDLRRAKAAGADIIGINNRDLGTFEVSLQTCRRLVKQIPRGTLCVAESGIGERRVIEELMLAGVDAFLIGTALLNADDPGHKLRELRGDGRN